VELSASENNNKCTYKWLPAQLFDYDYNTPVVKVHADKSAMVTLEVTNEYGCTSMDSVMLNTKPCCELYLPSAFSPNGDGKNDLFRILNPGRHKLESLKVYNRYGQEVFTTSVETDGWNGSYNGVAQEIGTYQYMVKYKCDDKDTYIKGEVTLVR
jgi:gliding motility-associated-like protein